MGSEDLSDAASRFTVLLEPHRGALWRFASRMSWEKGNAEDVLQEAIMIAYRKFATFQAGTDFKAWVYQILVNTLLNANAKHRRALQDTAHVENLDLVQALERENTYASVMADPDRFLERVADPIKKSVNALSPHERLIFLLRSVEGFSYREIAKLLDLPMGTVMSHLFRARLRLREDLSDYAREHGLAREAS